MKFATRKSAGTAAASGLLLVAALAGCSAQKVDTGATAGRSDKSGAPLYSRLPQSVKTAGKLQLGTDATSAPFATVADDGKTIVGVNADLANAIQPLIGVKVTMENVNFDQSVSSVRTGRADLYWDWSTDSAEKRAQVDLIDFATTGQGLLVAQGNPKDVHGFSDLCGQAVAAQQGSNNVVIAQQASATDCVHKGKAAIKVLQFDSVPAALLQVKEERATAVVTAYAVCAYTGKESSEYDLAGSIISAQRAGIVVAKDRKDLRGVVQAALQQLVDSGKYGQILKKWGLGSAALSKITVNDQS
ncbi:transporter substrate-binding domain-containing protein [Streptomyces prunicolor]